MQLSKKYTALTLLFAHTCALVQAVDLPLEQKQEPTHYQFARITLESEHLKEHKEQRASAFDTAHYMRYALVPAAAVGVYLLYQNFNNITATARSGLSMLGNAGRFTWNGIAAVGNFVPSRVFGTTLIPTLAITVANGADAVEVPDLNDAEKIAIRNLLNRWTFLTVATIMARNEVEQFAKRTALYIYAHSFDGGAQNLKMFVDRETSLAEIRFYLRDWLQDMQTVLAESSIDSLYDTLYEFDKLVIADAEKVIAFISSLKEYAHMQNADVVDRKVKMLIDETNLFAESAERMLNEQQTQQENNRQLTLSRLMNRTLTFIGLLNREVLSFMQIHQKPA